jgi:hypothetical protein
MMRLLGLVLVLAMAASLVGCGGSPSGVSTILSAPPTANTTTTVPDVSRFYGTYNAIFDKVLDTGCDIAFAPEGRITLSGDPDGSNVTIEVNQFSGYKQRRLGDAGAPMDSAPAAVIKRSSWLTPRIYGGSIDAEGRFLGSEEFEFVTNPLPLTRGGARRHNLIGTIGGTVQEPLGEISGLETMVFGIGILVNGSFGCPGNEVRLEFTGRP